MASIKLRYGRSDVSVDYDEARFAVLRTGVEDRVPLSDPEIGERLDDPIGSPKLEEIVRPGDSVLLVVPDATRQTGAGQVVNLVVRRLIANGSAPHEIAAIFATGIHRPVTEEEKAEILTPFIAQRIRTIRHDASDAIKLFRTGETAGGIPVELNWVVTEFERIVLIGGVSFHYFAGFTGGRKLICPGLASARTIAETHKLAFDCDLKGRRSGVGPGILDGNPVHAAFEEGAATVNPSFAVNTIVNGDGNILDLYCGDWKSSHRQACDAFSEENTVSIAERRDAVVASCGGWPFDINMIQAHKTLEAASRACREGGDILLLAECPEGLGRTGLDKWFEPGNSRGVAEMLCGGYEVNGQTAWSLMQLAERFNVSLVSELDPGLVRKMRMKPATMADAARLLSNGTGYLIPAGSKLLIQAGDHLTPNVRAIESV